MIIIVKTRIILTNLAQNSSPAFMALAFLQWKKNRKQNQLANIPLSDFPPFHTNGFVHDPCWHPGKTWHSLHVFPDQPRRHRHSPGASQYPLVTWQSLRQIAVNRKYSSIVFNVSFRSSSNYVQNRRVHPTPCYKCIQMTHCKCHVDNRVGVYTVHNDHHKNPNYSDIHRAVCNSLEVDHSPYGKWARHTGHLAILKEVREEHCD